MQTNKEIVHGTVVLCNQVTTSPSRLVPQHKIKIQGEAQDKERDSRQNSG